MWYTSKIFIFLFLWAYLVTDAYAHRPLLYGKNLGHRGGKKHFEDLPENSLILLEHALKGGTYGKSIQHREDFMYLELDVQETLDGHLVVFHDRYLRRMIPNSKENKKVYQSLLSDIQFMKRTGYESKYKEFRVQDLTLEELKKFHLRDFPDQSIPTLEEYLSHARQFGLYKPLAIDVKGIQTNKVKYLLASIATNFLRDYLQKINIVFERDYQLIGPLIFLASPWSLRNFVFEDDDTQQYQYSHNDYMPVFFGGRYIGYLLVVEQKLFFFEEPKTSGVRVERFTYQQPLEPCAVALH